MTYCPSPPINNLTIRHTASMPYGYGQSLPSGSHYRVSMLSCRHRCLTLSTRSDKIKRMPKLHCRVGLWWMGPASSKQQSNCCYHNLNVTPSLTDCNTLLILVHLFVYETWIYSRYYFAFHDPTNEHKLVAIKDSMRRGYRVGGYPVTGILKHC